MEWCGIHGEYKDNPFVVYPAASDPYGCDVVREHANHWDADLTISLVDLWVQGSYADTLPQRWMPYFPIDSIPIPPEIYNLAKRTQWPVTYSQWGVNELAKVGVQAYYVPHGVGDAYRPNLEAGRRWRMENGIPQDAYMVASVYANKGNPSRKNFDGCFRAFAEFSKTHPDAIYYMHSEPSVRYQGVDLWRLIRELGIAGKVIIPNSYLLALGFDETWMAGMYNAADVLLSATKGEGWCFIPGAPVYTSEGIVPIERVLPNNMVLNAYGKYAAVKSCQRRTVKDEQVYNILARGMSHPLQLTGQHPVWALRPIGFISSRFANVRKLLERGLQPAWIPASEIGLGDFLVSPLHSELTQETDEIHIPSILVDENLRVNNGRVTTKFSNGGADGATGYSDVAKAAGVSYNTASRVLGNYIAKDARVGRETQIHIRQIANEIGWKDNKREIPETLIADMDTGFVFGYYLSEGSFSGGVLEWASHAKEESIRQRLCKILEGWGVSPTCSVDGNGASVTLANVVLGKLLVALCGRGSQDKHLPALAFTAKKFAIGLLQGAFCGDGSLAKNGVNYSTSSRELAYGLRCLLLQFGILAYVRGHQRDRVCGKEYTVCVGGKQVSKIADLVLMQPTKTTERTGQGFIIYGDYAYLPVTSISTEIFSGEVYNLEIEGHPSYCVDGVAVHNCIPVTEAQACGTPVIVTNYSALIEQVDHPGPSYKVRVAEWEICPLHSRFAIPDTEDIVKGLEMAYNEWRGGKPFTELSTWAEQYYWDNVITNGWGPMLAKVEHDLNQMQWKSNEHPVLSTAIVGGQ